MTDTPTDARAAAVADANTANARNLRRLNRAVDLLARDNEVTAAALVAAEDFTTLATTVALIATERKRLQDLENELATALGKAAGKHIGTLADGARYEVTKSTDRKDWDHDDWKRDVRREVTKAATAGLPEGARLQHTNLATGEVVETTLAGIIQEALAMAQEVHGSTAPRSGALKGLGLYASDYATSTPGAWRVNFIKPDTTTPDVPTTTKDTL